MNPRQNPTASASIDNGITAMRKTTVGTNTVYVNIAPGAPVHPGEAIHIRGTSRSYSPWDKKAAFEWDIGDETYAFTNLSTVFSTRIVPNLGSEAQSVTNRLALPPEGWTLPAAPGTLHPLRLYDDVLLTPMQRKTLTLDGTPGAFKIWLANSTNGTPLLVTGQTTTNGQPVTFAVPGTASSVWLEALAPGSATLTTRFNGISAAYGFNHADTLNVVAIEPSLLLQVTPNPPANSMENVFGSYRPGYRSPGSPEITLGGNTFTPQKMRLAADLPHGSGLGVTQVRFTLSDVTSHPGFCMNASAPSGTGGGDSDYSFSASGNSASVTVAFTDGRAVTDFWCKDYGGYCKVTAEFLDASGNVAASAGDEAPRRSPDAQPGDNIAEHWRQSETQWWQSRYPLIPAPSFAMDWDDEPANLGNARTDGSYSHGAPGDGLTVWQEYRGYWLDGGFGIDGPRHLRLSLADKELLVQVMAQDDYLSGVGTGDATNPDAVQAFSLDDEMNAVAAFYRDETRGLGIEMFWVRTPFTMPLTYFAFGIWTNYYHYTGEIECAETENGPTTSVITNGTMWIYRDNKLAVDSPQRFKATYGHANMGIFIAKNRDDTLYGDFVKVAFPSRTGIRQEDGSYQTTSHNHAEAYFTGADVMIQGAHIDVVSISEERFIDGKINYTVQTFVDVLEYCVGHEICHLIGGRHGLVPITPPSQPGAIMDSFRPLNLITGSQGELLQIDLPNRASVVK